jgi:hypothetical protein
MSKYTGDMRPDPWIVCAAIKNKEGDILLGIRHFDRFMRQFTKSYSLVYKKERPVSTEWKQAEQGFVDQYGAFYTREAAYEVAAKNGQIRRPEGGTPGTLYSENLY